MSTSMSMSKPYMLPNLLYTAPMYSTPFEPQLDHASLFLAKNTLSGPGPVLLRPSSALGIDAASSACNAVKEKQN